jgi:hypothetical protein
MFEGGVGRGAGDRSDDDRDQQSSRPGPIFRPLHPVGQDAYQRQRDDEGDVRFLRRAGERDQRADENWSTT